VGWAGFRRGVVVLVSGVSLYVVFVVGVVGVVVVVVGGQ
jgi:hypothetical protein